MNTAVEQDGFEDELHILSLLNFPCMPLNYDACFVLQCILLKTETVSSQTMQTAATFTNNKLFSPSTSNIRFFISSFSFLCSCCSRTMTQQLI
jgi:hypothetical protein